MACQRQLCCRELFLSNSLEPGRLWPLIITVLQAGAGEQQEQKGQAAQKAVATAPDQTPDAAKPSRAVKTQAKVLGKRKKGSAAEEESAAAPFEQLDLIAAGTYPV